MDEQTFMSTEEIYNLEYNKKNFELIKKKFDDLQKKLLMYVELNKPALQKKNI